MRIFRAHANYGLIQIGLKLEMEPRGESEGLGIIQSRTCSLERSPSKFYRINETRVVIPSFSSPPSRAKCVLHTALNKFIFDVALITCGML